MKIVINKLFGKFNTEIEIDKNLNILVGENGIGKSNILRICNYILNNNYAELTRYYFDNIKIYDDNYKVSSIYHSELFPTKNEICNEIESKKEDLDEDLEENDRLINLIEQLDYNNLLNEFMVYCYFDSNLSVKLERCLDIYSYNKEDQIKNMKWILNKMYEENSDDKRNIKSFVYMDEIVKKSKQCYYLDFVENYKIENKLHKKGNVKNNFNENDNEIFDAEKYIYNRDEYLYGEYTGNNLYRLHYERNNSDEYSDVDYPNQENWNYDSNDETNYDEYNLEYDDLESSDYEDLFSKSEDDDFDSEYNSYYEDEKDFEFDIDDDEIFNIYKKQEFFDEIEKNILRIEKYKFKNIETEPLNINDIVVNQLISNKNIDINKLISNLYYDEEFIKKIYIKINNLDEKYKNYFLAKKYKFAQNVDAYNPSDEEIRKIREFYKDEKNKDKIKNYLLPLMPKDSPYEFFIARAFSNKIVKEDNYIFFRLYEIYNSIIEDIENYKNQKNVELEELLNKYIRNKKIIIKPTGIHIFDKEMNNNKEILETNYEKNIELNSLSAGEKKIIILLTLNMFVDDSIFIIDEIENSLSIIWQEEIINDLIKINERNNLIIATQSAYALKNKNIQQDILFLPYEEV